MNEPLVSVLFITYKRAHLLRRTLHSFREHTTYPKLELVVTDDGSPVEVQDQILRLPFDRFVMNKQNRGLGFNTNRGLEQCTGEFVLSLQDDWVCEGPPDYLSKAVALMKADPRVGLLRFYGIEDTSQFLIKHSPAGELYSYIPKEFTHAHMDPVYSDTPHLKSRKLISLVGKYQESLRMEDCEREYQLRFRNQPELEAAFIPDQMNRVFLHVGREESFRTGTLRYRIELRLAKVLRPLRGLILYNAAKHAYQKFFHRGRYFQ